MATERRLAKLFSRQAYQWARAMRVQRDRVCDASATTGDRVTDAVLFAVALRDLLRVAETSAKWFESEGIRLALEHLGDRMPDLRELRDALEHFDECEVGAGKQRQSAYRLGFRESADHFELGVAGGLTIDIVVAEDAASELAAALMRELDELSGPAPGRLRPVSGRSSDGAGTPAP